MNLYHRGWYIPIYNHIKPRIPGIKFSHLRPSIIIYPHVFTRVLDTTLTSVLTRAKPVVERAASERTFWSREYRRRRSFSPRFLVPKYPINLHNRIVYMFVYQNELYFKLVQCFYLRIYTG